MMRLTKTTLLALCIDEFDIRIDVGNIYILLNNRYMYIDSTGTVKESSYSQYTIATFKKPTIETYKSFCNERVE